MKYLLPVLTLTLVGCVAPNILPPASNTDLSKLKLSVIGLQTHGMYPNDVAWLNIYNGDIEDNEKAISQYRLTTDKPNAYFPIDSNKKYTYRIHTVESHFGGFSSCVVAFNNTPESNITYSVEFTTNKSSCQADITAIDITGKVITNTRIDGGLGGGIQFTTSGI